ncbi:MAG: hypothetical protein KF745_07825 [Phycisphaeraceae bacterium]|nr:hypothetical protein [Phycisphaeraceae bacterium]
MAMRQKPSQIAWTAACMTAAGLLASCGGEPVAVRPSDGTGAMAAASPVVVGGDNGLELRWWVSSASPAEFGAVLAEYAARPVPLDPGQKRMLEANGLRCVAVPLEQLPEVQSRLSVIGAMQRQWLGQAPAWIEAVPGPSRPGGQTIAMHDGPLRLGPGRLRLLARCWTIPVAPRAGSAGGSEAALHIELIPQHEEPKRDELSDSAGRLRLNPTPAAVEDQGLLFSRLHVTMEVAEGDAYLLVPELPDTMWEARTEGEATAEGTASRPAGAGGGSGSAPPIGQVVRESETGPKPGREQATGDRGRTGPPGPPSAQLPTLGQAMLMSVVKIPDSGVDRTVRAVVLLVPRVPKEYRLVR